MLTTSKWAKYKILQADASIVPYLPETRWFRENHLSELLTKYGSIVLKPTAGGGGAGVMKVSVAGPDTCIVHAGATQSKISRKHLYAFLLKKMKTTSYIIQKLIPLSAVAQRPFDVRVMVQRGKGSAWIVTGKLAKVAGKGFMITNVARSKGYVLPVEAALTRSNVQGASAEKIGSLIDQVALRAAERLQQSYPSIQNIGFDMGIDQSGGVWIIEANFKPSLSLFQRLKDPVMYRRIVSFKRK